MPEDDPIGGLQSCMKGQFDLPNLGTGFTIEDHGNHYIVRKGDKELNVSLFAAQQVFEALRFAQGNS